MTIPHLAIEANLTSPSLVTPPATENDILPLKAASLTTQHSKPQLIEQY
jgi:hypothetical protein